MTTHPDTRVAAPVVALVGNPNAGKTSLFNRLTGSSQRVGNYPGVTVEKVSGTLRLGGQRVECVDLPGLYSLRADSADEAVATEVLTGSRSDTPRPDVVVCVIDATNLERNLFFFSQVAELGLPVVVALTMSDLVEGGLDVGRLESLLGVPVVPVVAHKGTGIEELRKVIDGALRAPATARPPEDLGDPASIAAESLRERLARNGLDLPRAEVSAALRGENPNLIAAIDEFPELHAALLAAQEQAAEEAKHGDAARRYAWAARVREAALPTGRSRIRTISDRIDRVLTHRVFGLLIFVGVMYLVFQSIYTFAGPLMELIDGGFARAKIAVSPMLEGTPVLQSLVVDGLITGVGSAIIFLPQIAILFFFIAFLEGSGYLARASFLMDRLLGWCGLNGRAFIPLLSSFACAIPGIMAARVMPDPKSRLATILVAPLMSCSARLPVYILIIGAFIQPKFGNAWAGVALFAMHFVGLAVAIPTVFVLNRGLLRGKRLPFVLELPPYQWPKWRDVWLTVVHRGRVFLHTAGTIIVVLSIVIWALTYFPRGAESEARYRAEYAALPAAQQTGVTADNFVAERQTENSYLGRMGKAIEPVFAPLGFDWRLSTAILMAFPAREVVVPSLGIIFSLGGEVDEASGDLTKALASATWPDGRTLMTPWTAVGLMVFFALCCQCMATLATIKRETNSWKWPIFTFVYMTTLAYLFAWAIQGVGRLVG